MKDATQTQSTQAAPFFARYLERALRVKTALKAGTDPKIPEGV